ncbi:DUF6668 family protein [Agromyces sp. NPDC058126]|uniref:DUF6668 family protein n=1 Tax=Agromyces sp. NPDC058126 TaxID=3346350 RepID=UPI0036DA2B4C
MTQNPFLTEPVRATRNERPEPDPVFDDRVELTGPATPELAPPVDTTGLRDWPVQPVLPGTGLFVVGLHGGAGISTVVELLGSPAIDAGQAVPDPAGSGVVNMVAVTRTHHHGLEQAHRFARLWADGRLGRVRLLGLLLVDDGPNLTRAQRLQVRRVSRMSPHGWHLGWQEPWRLQAPDRDRLPMRVRWTLHRIHTFHNLTKEGKQ